MIPFSPPRIDQKIIDEVSEALRSGWITTGPRTKKFEKELASFCGVEQVLCVNSATAGMELMLRWLGVQEGDEVLVPAYTYCATANVVVHCGAKPVMVDVGTDFNIQVTDLEKYITPKTKAIIPVDVGGLPNDYDALNKLVNREDIKARFTPGNEIQNQLGRILLLADAAHSIGATYKGRNSGTLADVSVFSFHAVKNLTTAEGGAIALNLPDSFDQAALYQQLNVSSLHGQSKDALAKVQKGGWRYDVVEAGYKCNMTDIQAAIGLVELDRYKNDTLVRRKSIFDRYSELLSQYDWAIIPEYESEEKVSSMHLYLLRIKGASETQRDAIIDRIFQQDVSVNVHYLPLPMLTFYKDLGYTMEDYPGAYRQYANEITLPAYYTLSDDDIDLVVKGVANAVSQELS